MTDPPPSSRTSGVNALRLEEPRPVDPDPAPREPAPEFRTIFERECGYVWHALRRLGVRERDLEDLAHDVFVTVHKRLADYDPSRPIKPWLFGIAFRHASDYRRLARNRLEIVSPLGVGGESPEPADDAPGADVHYEQAEARRLVAEALESLDLDKRAVFVMHEIDGHAMPEIAEALKIPLNTAYSRLRLAREQFAVVVRRLRARKLSPRPVPRNTKGGGR
jgi:RNA polymerase sigma-70 factor (ECF subfamily)